MGARGASQGTWWVKDPPAMLETQVPSLGREDPLEEGMAARSSTLAWRTPWTEGPAGYSPWGHSESDTTEVTEHTLMGARREKCLRATFLRVRPQVHQFPSA